MSKISLIYLHPHFTLPGGAGNVVLESASRLNREKYNIKILCIRATTIYKTRYPLLSFMEIGGPLSNSPFFWLLFPYVQFKIHRALNRFPHKIILPQVLPSNWWAFIYRMFHKHVPCLWYCHEPSAFIHIRSWIESIPNPCFRWAAKMLNPILKAIDAFLVAKGPDLVLCNSMFTKDLSEKIYGKTIREIVYPGTDIHHFIPQQTKKHYFFSFAHLTKFKEIHVAIEAMAKIKNRDYSLVIGGEGEEKDALIGLSKRLGLSGRVRFVGLVPPDELPKLYAESKLLLFTSKHEPFGMVPIEAMASGTPVIGPNSGGLRETIKHNYNGILLDELTADHMAKAIDDLLDAPDKYDYLRKNARISAEKFSWEKHVEKLETALNELVHSHRG